MFKSKHMTPLGRRTDHSNPPKFGGNGFNPPRPPFAKRHSSTSSNDSLGKKIQRHLDAGNPLYIGFDPADPPRDSTLMTEQGKGGDTLVRVDGDEHTVAGRKKNWSWRAVKVLCCGVPLDICARIILTAGMILALLSLLWSVNRLIRMFSPTRSVLSRTLILNILERKGIMHPDNLTFTSYIIIFQCVWGIFFGATCLFGFVLMWGKWRRSPTAALFFTVTWILVTILLIVASVLWFYFYFSFRNKHTKKCREKTTSTGPVFDRDAPFRQATQDQINNCLLRVRKQGDGVLVWGVVYAVMLYAAIIVIIWGGSYRRRLMEIRGCEERVKGPGEGEKVGLLLGTAPLGRLAHSRRVTIGPKRSEVEGSLAGKEKREPKNTIVRFSSTVRMGEAAPTSSSSHQRHCDRKGSNSSAESLGLGISVEGQSFVGSSSQGRSMGIPSSNR
ncbi:hypothetical protein HOY80DRAFT_419332 [Tuber brumale]|nr:hypothetical protein HOY80DRAFT_419332 [Tuber brumale]